MSEKKTKCTGHKEVTPNKSEAKANQSTSDNVPATTHIRTVSEKVDEYNERCCAWIWISISLYVTLQVLQEKDEEKPSEYKNCRPARQTSQDAK